ncbi:MAG: hypothetical protein N2C14_23455 [Planctomycetales bacterium]
MSHDDTAKNQPPAEDVPLKRELRDHFAAKALQTLLHRFDLDFIKSKDGKFQIAHQSYKLADAMMQARDPK